MSSNQQPSTLAFLAKYRRERPFDGHLCFIKPQPGIELVILHEDDGLETLRIVQLLITGQTCVPLHRHISKEKTYVVQPNGDSAVAVMLGIVNPADGGMDMYTMVNAGETFVVPKNHWHMLWVPEQTPTHAKLLVVSSSQDGNDVEWTPKGDLLVEFTRRVGRDCQGESPLRLPYDELDKHLNTLLGR